MTGRLACQLSNLIVAFAQVAGTAAVLVASTCHPGRAVPILEMHGTADTTVPYNGGTVAPQLGGRGEVMSVDAWAAFWVANDGDAPEPQVSTIGTTVTVRSWYGASQRCDVVFYRIEGTGHTWPGGTQPGGASETIWRFLAAHRAA